MKKIEKKQTVLVMGGGASGMMAAITAAQCGARVMVLEHTKQLGKKLLLTGNGRCNLSNRYQEPICYHGEHPEFAWQVYQHFLVEDTITFFEKNGLYLRSRNGYLYPYSNQACAVRELFLGELKRLRVSVELGVEIINIKKENEGGFFLRAEDGRTFFGTALILACGSKAFRKTGSDGSGYRIAKDLGHTVMEPLPALVPLECKGDFWKKLAGVRAEADITLCSGEKSWRERGELQITEYGISGIPVFQLSRFAVNSLYEKQSVQVEMDFLPDMDRKHLEEILTKQIQHRQKTLYQALSGLIHSKIALYIAECVEKEERKKDGQSKRKERADVKRAALYGKMFSAQVNGYRSFENAQVCQGGILTEEIHSHTMESKLLPGLYFAGEIVDIDGICGGYNLQWAWSSGYLAGKSAAEKRG